MPKKRAFDPILLGVTIGLVVIGIIMVYTSSAIVALNRFGDPHYYLKRHITWSVIGITLMLLVMKIDYWKHKKFTFPLLALSFVLLIAVLIPDIGKEVGGARRWLQIGPFRFQPAEIVKISISLFLAGFLVRKKEEITDFTEGFLPMITISGIFFILIFLQPDLGTAVLILAVTLTMMFVGGVRMRCLVGMGLLLSPFLYFAIYNVEYRWRRIKAFLDPWSDPSDSGFQIIQSLISFGRGHFFGTGLGAGKQKLLFLPEPHTDFIFSVAGEELGLLGSVLILLAFGVLVWRGLRVSMRSSDLYGSYLALGITFTIAIQVLMNVYVTLGLLPTKGIPLPLMSVGGTSLVTYLIMIGILLNISEHTT